MSVIFLCTVNTTEREVLRSPNEDLLLQQCQQIKEHCGCLYWFIYTDRSDLHRRKARNEQYPTGSQEHRLYLYIYPKSRSLILIPLTPTASFLYVSSPRATWDHDVWSLWLTHHHTGLCCPKKPVLVHVLPFLSDST